MLKVCVIGLGYVGLPLLLNFSKKYQVIGYDKNKKRISDLKKGKDVFNEFKKNELKKVKLKLTSELKEIKNSTIFIVTVPTPIKKNKSPDLSHLKDVCLNISGNLKKNDMLIFESTVYPGLTRDYCIPLLQRKNSLIEGKDFFVGYSPERINPGDKKHQLKSINKILAYPYNFKKKEILKLYSSVGKKIIYTKNVEEAETAKVIENIQRDVNIGLMNEIYLACEKLGLNFENIIKLARTKWNFLKFEPGLVGGHCLPVDPYYFASICKKNKFNTKITLAGRDINDSMVDKIKKKTEVEISKIKSFKLKKILICGLTYKKNVADLRNSLSLEIFKKLKKKYKNIKGFDPLVDSKIAKKNYFSSKIKTLYDHDILIILTKHDLIINEINKVKGKKIISIF